ncbi:Neutrophil cytosol factor 2 [Ceratocystis fimbriata CBS 114723]|uniref:Neutrophil cytosol factor 2 n=1 Tax=Ceratocystis fimbriata CBS 114723 TaxID=1035309 RepID=A0A2C5X2E5_9PEZI|nr:Neutrophil cytosol factor 2 [Ceratocystis fimbriata CBS 114723]
MSLKQEIETWVQAINNYENNEFDEALRTFESISDTSKILFNIGVIHATLGEHQKAVTAYQKAVRLDQYLAVAYFQQGVSNFLLGDFEEALANFNDTLLYLRGNTLIDYAQLGLLFKLYSCEVLFNRGLCYIYLQQVDAGMQDLNYAVKEKVVEDHNVIDDAIREKAEGYTVFSIPVGIIYRPNDAKVRNLKTKDYLGKARLVAASDRANTFTGFAGSEMKNAIKSAPKDDRPADNISFAATNLVKRDLISRPTASGSTSSTNASILPPTPPPENDRPVSTARAMSVRNGPRPMLPKLNIAQNSQNGRYEKTRSPDDRDRRAPSSSISQVSSNPRSAPPQDNEFDDVYNMYNSGTRRSSNAESSGRMPTRRNIPQYIEDDASDYDSGSIDERDFEMVGGGGNSQRRMTASSRGTSRRPDIRNIRIKVHFQEESRYVLVPTTADFVDIEDRIRNKFAIRRRFKMLMREDNDPKGDMITMGDQDDVDLAIMNAKNEARRAKWETGKLEVWAEELM